MHLLPRSAWAIAIGLILLVLAGVGTASQAGDDPVIDTLPVYLPAIAKNYPDFFPPPVQAKMEGWLRKWRESQPPNACLQASGTPYYLERQRGEAGWLAAIAATEAVSELELEVHLDEKVAVSGTVEYFDVNCGFPRLEARTLEVIDVVPD